jgi:sugar phosphate isomerase/epimerase
MVAPATDPLGADILETIASQGYDYIELSQRDLVPLSEDAVLRLIARLEKAGLACEACNNFFPPEVRLTGPTADLAAALRYAEKAFAVSARLGVKIIVFGSSGARNVPEGFSHERAWAQLRELLVALGPRAEAHDITIVIEPLNKGESNIIHTVSDGWRLAQEVAHPRVQVLADAYHIRQENEDPSILSKLGPALRHVHVAQKAERVFPAGNDPELTAFFRELRASGYAGRLSVEGFTQNFAADAAVALRTCRQLSGI